jgi:hypothetical protein
MGCMSASILTSVKSTSYRPTRKLAKQEETWLEMSVSFAYKVSLFMSNYLVIINIIIIYKF